MSLSLALDQPESYVSKTARLRLLRFFFFGLLLPLGFAPFHIPGMSILGMALFYHHLNDKTPKSAFQSGLLFGFGFFGFGISWIYVSIHDYGHLHGSVAALITVLFIFYLALFPALTALLFCRLSLRPSPLRSAVFFSALWVLSEVTRATFLTGFPWLLLGYGQFDSPIKYLLPVLGVYGGSFITCLTAALLSQAMRQNEKRLPYLLASVALLLSPLLFKPISWAQEGTTPVSVGVVQANLSMRDKWDETLFWQLIDRYEQDTRKLLGQQLIVLPESAIPLPAPYISDFLGKLHQELEQANSALLLGIPEATNVDETFFYNAMISLGNARGTYLKQHLVPFGEYIPKPLINASAWFSVPDANMVSGRPRQALQTVHGHPIASLICYEIAYGNLLRRQLPMAEWIVTISDDGWFGHSLAPYQQQQMAQVLSLQSARYQVVANNDGLSSLINTRGDLEASLPAFSDGLLKSELYPASGQTPWVSFGDWPVLIFSLLIIISGLIYRLTKQNARRLPIAARHERGYPYQPS